MFIVNEMEEYYTARAGEYEETARYALPRRAAGTTQIKARYQLAFEGRDVLELACGPGYWTETVAVTARSVLATDRDPGLVAMTAARLERARNVRCAVADAYDLGKLTGEFNACFANFWWSHIPKSRLGSFLTGLHAKLSPGSRVIFTDCLPYKIRGGRRIDEHGDLIETRTLRNGNSFEIIKNFPTESEILTALEGHADAAVYKCFTAGGHWTVSYLTKPAH